jgi:hypothetical protein
MSYDKVFVGGSFHDKLIFIENIIECLNTKAPNTLLITISELSEYLQKQSTLSNSNLYRKVSEQ